MAKRSSGGLLWLLIGAVALLALVPREIWIALAVLAGIAFAAYLAVKLLGVQATRNNRTPEAPPSVREPTLSELMASSKKAEKNHYSSAAPTKQAKSEPRDPRLAHQRPEWIRHRATQIDENRRRAEELRAKYPSFPQIVLDRILLSEQPVLVPEPEAIGSSVSPDPPSTRAQSDGRDEPRATLDKANRERLKQLREKFASAQRQSSDFEPRLGWILEETSDVKRTIGSDSGQSGSSGRSDHQQDLVTSLHVAEPETLYRAATAPSPQPSHQLPTPPAGIATTRWLKAGESIQIAGHTIPGGLIYVGPKLKAANGIVDPALINPLLQTVEFGDFRQRYTNYWPSYSDITPEARNAYLSWLSQGRSHPDCEIGFVFLFFYGLERRVIFDSQSDPAAKEDRPEIAQELCRLLSIYATRSESFKRYASELLNWVELDGTSSKLYTQPLPAFNRNYELPPYLRLALGQASSDRAPVPPELALAWLRLSPEVSLRTAATRCPKQFERLFLQRYQEVFGPGLVLQKNRTKLKFAYQPASLGLSGAKITMGFGDIPDVTALTAPIKQLREIADQCTDELGPYSRLVGKDPASAGSLEALLLLPATLWPSEAQGRLRTLVDRMRDGWLRLTLRELIDALGGSSQLFSRDQIRSLARALEAEQIGFEPYVLAGAKMPGPDDAVVLFAQPNLEPAMGGSAGFQTATITLQLAAATAQADGDFHEKEISHLRAEIEGWAQLTPAERRRLHAHLHWLTASPPTLASLKKKLEPLSASAKETLAGFMAALAQADGYVSPDEVKFLEKIYKVLGVETKRVFSDIHAAEAGGTAASSSKQERKGFQLDTHRIAALQEDTARVSALLSKIFAEEAPPSPPAPTAAEPEPEEADAPLLGLDETHAAFLRLLLSRPEWSRSELEDAAADLDLMLDGALEQINEAAFDAFDGPLCEGDDPIEVHTELIEKIEA